MSGVPGHTNVLPDYVEAALEYVHSAGLHECARTLRQTIVDLMHDLDVAARDNRSDDDRLSSENNNG